MASTAGGAGLRGLGFLPRGARARLGPAAGCQTWSSTDRRHETSRLAADRADYRRRYRAIRAKHAALFAHAGELAARGADLGVAGRLVYRGWWAQRPLPAALEQGMLPAPSPGCGGTPRAVRRSSAKRRAISDRSRQHAAPLRQRGRPRATARARLRWPLGRLPGRPRPRARRARSGPPRCAPASTRIGRSAPRYSNSLPVASPRRVPAVNSSSRLPRVVAEERPRGRRCPRDAPLPARSGRRKSPRSSEREGPAEDDLQPLRTVAAALTQQAHGGKHGRRRALA